MYSDFMIVRKNGAECLIDTPRELGVTGQGEIAHRRRDRQRRRADAALRLSCTP